MRRSTRAVTTIDKTLSQIEFKAIFLELFSLAWPHRVHRRDLILLQELFSRSYAESTNSLAVWEAVTEYNRSVSDSADTETFESKRETIATLTARGTDATVGERTVNRLATEHGWKSGATAELLAGTFLTRLGLGPTSWALDSVHEVIASMYKRGDSAIKVHKFVVEE